MVLYRKYRPKTFSEIIGQEHIVKTLTNAIQEGIFSHAYLFYGPRGSGKTTIARLLAKAINCENRKGYEPCNKCSACQEINEGRAIDLIEIDAASNRGIDEVRQIKEGAKFPPTRLKYKVFIIDEAHQLSKDAANALLKILEEPPKHVVFILATTEIQKMIPTIISRCQRFDFYRLRKDQIIKKLNYICQQEKIRADDEALDLIATNAEGAMRDAESLLEQIITYAQTLKKDKIEKKDVQELLGLVENETIIKFLDFLVNKKSKEAIEFLNQNIQKGIDPSNFLKTLIKILRHILLLQIDNNLSNVFLDQLTQETKECLIKYAKKIPENDLRIMLKKFMEAEARIKYSPIPQLPIELSVIEICES